MKSTFSTLFYLKKNQPKSNGLIPVMARITINDQIAQFGTKLDINPDLWDTKAGKAIGRTEEATNINRSLNSMKVSIDQYYQKQLETYGYATPEKIKN